MDFKDEEEQEITRLIDYLVKHEKYFESFVNRLKQSPKTLLIYPSFGFKGYPEEFSKLTKELEAGK